jgi:hypothetical protein
MGLDLVKKTTFLACVAFFNKYKPSCACIHVLFKDSYRSDSSVITFELNHEHMQTSHVKSMFTVANKNM